MTNVKFNILIEQYWDILKQTRKSRRISEGIKKRERQFWDQFDPEIVSEALQIHMRDYPKYRESYTRGIIRHLALKKQRGEER